MTIAALLAQSRIAHRRYRQLHADTRNRDLVAQGAAIREALRTRTEAHALDPDQTELLDFTAHLIAPEGGLLVGTSALVSLSNEVPRHAVLRGPEFGRLERRLEAAAAHHHLRSHGIRKRHHQRLGWRSRCRISSNVKKIH